MGLGTRGASCLALMGCAFGCSSSDSLWLPMPETPFDVNATLVVLETADTLEVHRVVPGGPFEHPVPDAEEVGVQLLLYEDDAVLEGVEIGELPKVPREPPGRSVPRATRSYRSTVHLGTIDPWEESDERSAALEVFKLDRKVSCTGFEPETLEAPTFASLVFFVTLRDGRTLIADNNGDLFLYDRGEILPVERPASFKPVSAFLDESGQLWMGTSRAEVVAVDLEGASVTLGRTFTSSAGDALRWIDGGGVWPELEIFALSPTGGLLRFSRGEVEEVYRFPQIPSREMRAGVVWIGPGEVAAVAYSSNLAVHITQGTVDEQVLPTLFGGTSIARIPGHGLVAGTMTGELFLLESGKAPRLLGATGTGLAIDVILSPEAKRFYFAGANGWFGEYDFERGFCPAAQLASSGVRAAAQLENGDLLLGGVRVNGSLTDLTVLRNTDEP